MWLSAVSSSTMGLSASVLSCAAQRGARASVSFSTATELFSCQGLPAVASHNRRRTISLPMPLKVHRVPLTSMPLQTPVRGHCPGNIALPCMVQWLPGRAWNEEPWSGKGSHLVEAHAGEHARPVGVREGASQRVQRRDVAGAAKAQHA